MHFKGEVKVRVRVGLWVSELVGRVRVSVMVYVDEDPHRDRCMSVCLT